MLSFANTLKQLRKEKHFTQESVAEVLGIDRSTYAYYEAGKTKPDFETILTMCRIYGVGIDEITRMILTESNVSMVLSSEEKNYDDGETTFAKLDDREKLMLMLYRQTDDKDAFFEKVKQFYDEDVLKTPQATAD